MNMRLVDSGLVIISFIAGLANYEGLSMSVGGDWWTKSFCAIIAVGVVAFTFLMWHGAFAVAADLPRLVHRSRGWAITALGCVFLLAISSWWSVAALGGGEALRFGYEAMVADAEKSFARVSDTGALQSMKADLAGLHTEIVGLSECERRSGCISGTPGGNGVTATLAAIAGTVKVQGDTLDAAERRFEGRREDGKACLKRMRVAVSASTAADKRALDLAAGVECLNTVIADLGIGEVVARIGRAMAGLTTGAIIPVSVKSDRQKQAVETALASIKTKASAIATATAGIALATAAPISLPPGNAMTAVVRNWQAVIPAWSTAVALDLLPLILLMFQSTITASRRVDPEDAMMSWTVRDLVAAKEILGFTGELRTQPKTIDGTRPEPARASKVRLR